MCLFFLSIGLMLDIRYLLTNYVVILAITFAIMVINSLLSTIVFRSLRHNWRNSIYAGALLSQIGEYSLLASSLAYQLKIIELNFYKNVLIVSCLSLLFSTIWITILRAFIHKEKSTTRLIYQRISRFVSHKPSAKHQ
jgi:CPA2 family monovalent cation:H+ antiporter-2